MEKQAEASLDSESQQEDAPPPAYTERSDHAPPEPYEPQQGATKRIPSPINFYQGFARFWLGRHQDEKLFAISYGLAMFGRTYMTIYDGPTKHDPVLVTSRYEHRKYIMTIPDSAGSISVETGKVKGSGEDVVLNSSWKSSKVGFSLRVGDGSQEKPHEESFEWRRTHGDECRQLASGRSYGWKLVRLTNPIGAPAQAGQSSSVNHGRDFGVSSDGFELVAICAENARFSRKKSALFCFLNSGLDGSLGERFELVALLSGLIQFYKQEQANAAAGA